MILFVIFGVESFMQWQYSQEIMAFSEYRELMNIPAITILQQIKQNFQDTHTANMQIISYQSSDHQHKEFVDMHQESKAKLIKNIDDYYSLAYTTNANGEYLASKDAQEQIIDCTLMIRESVENYDKIFQMYQNNEISNSEIVSLLEEAKIDFYKIIDKGSIMEITTMKQIQNNVNEIERQMMMTFGSSTIIAIVTASITIIFIIRFVSKPITELIDMTKNIARGDFIKSEKKYLNTDINDIADSLNKMSLELENYKSKILKQEKLSSIGELASRLAHDIRNPLTVIKVTLDIIRSQNNNLSPEEIERFDRIDAAMYRITHQIDNVLDFIKGKPLKFVKIPLNDIMDSVMNDISYTKDVKFEIISEDIEIECDFEAIKVVLINLIINAMHAINNKGTIKISSKIRDNKAIIQIEDSGTGIPEEIMGKIFEPLFTTKQEGTGLGLASCKSLIEQHNGKISVENNPTRFIIELPTSIKKLTK